MRVVTMAGGEESRKELGRIFQIPEQESFRRLPSFPMFRVEESNINGVH